jgi:hypothetical protein
VALPDRQVQGPRRGGPRPREFNRFRPRYKGPAAVEREFGRLKSEWALSPLRVRGRDCFPLHADLTILAKLVCDLARALPLMG